MTPLKPTITYRLADLLTLAAEMKANHETQASATAGQDKHAFTNGYHTTMVQGTQRMIEKLEAFRATGVETVTAEFPIAEGSQRVFTNEDTSLGGQLHKGQIRPVMA